MPVLRPKEEIEKNNPIKLNPTYDLYEYETNKEKLCDLNDAQLNEIKGLAIKEERYELARLIKIEQRKREMNLENISHNELMKLRDQAIIEEDFDLVLLIDDVLFWKLMEREKARHNFFEQKSSSREIWELKTKLND